MTAEVAAVQETADSIVGERIHTALFRRRMTRRELGRQLGLSDQTIGKKINAVTTFTLDELLLVARVLEVDVTELLPGADYEPRAGGRGRKSAAPGGGATLLPWDGARVVRHQGLEPRTR